MVNSKTNYFNIGLFVLIGLAIVIATIITLGAKSFFKRAVFAETYFNESVQGLSNGSPVKYLGMEIGHVVDITTVDNIYGNKKGTLAQNGTRYIYIKMALSPRFFNSTSQKELNKEVTHDIEKGLRVKLALQGLTGTAYLELDFVDPVNANNLPVNVTWNPRYYYIPATTSTLAYFSENVQYLLKELRTIDFKAIADSLEKLINDTDHTMDNFNQIMSASNYRVSDIMNNLHNISQNMKLITERARIYPSSILFGQPPKKLDPGSL
jgi:ABC-type transporter Mla subunit MlaD